MLHAKLHGYCILGVQRLPEVLNNVSMVLLGDVFLRNFYSTFDIDHQRVHLGLKKNKADLAGIVDLHIDVEPETPEQPARPDDSHSIHN